MRKKKKALHKQKLPSGLTIYKPDHVPYQKLHLCKYLLELEETNPYRNNISENAQGSEETKGSCTPYRQGMIDCKS